MIEPEFNLQTSMDEFDRKVNHYYNVFLRADKIQNATDSQLRLMCGELTAQEIRSIRAVVNYIVGKR
jgi:hypothetical protein